MRVIADSHFHAPGLRMRRKIVKMEEKKTLAGSQSLHEYMYGNRWNVRF